MTNTTGNHMDATNKAQWEAWDGAEGAYWADHADRFDRGVRAYDQPLFDAAAIAADDRILDVGCGNGRTTIDAARLASRGTALGIDLSSRMLDVARDRTRDEGVENAQFVHGDAQTHPFESETFDVVMSRTGAMFFGDRVAAFTNIARATRPGGRLALAVWQPVSENEWFRSMMAALAAGRDLPPPPPEAPSPFALSDPEIVRPMLASAGFTGVGFQDVHAPMWFGPTADEAHVFMAGLLHWLVDDLDHATRDAALDELRRTMQDHEGPDGVQFGSGMWIVTATRTNP